MDTYLQLYADQVSFAAGFYVNGTFHLNVMQQLNVSKIVLSLEGKESYSATAETEEVIKLKFDLASFANQVLPPGHYSFPFQL